MCKCTGSAETDYAGISYNIPLISRQQLYFSNKNRSIPFILLGRFVENEAFSYCCLGRSVLFNNKHVGRYSIAFLKQEHTTLLFSIHCWFIFHNL
jgi:hypothetical protein